MIELNNTDVATFEWLRTFVKEHIGEGGEKTVMRLDKRLDNYISLCKLEPPITLSEEEIENSESCLSRLDALVKEYSYGSSSLSIDTLEELKRKMAGEIGYLATLRSEFEYQSNVLEEFSKRQFKATLIGEISEEQRVSVNQAEKIVEKDMRYVAMRRQSTTVDKYANKLKLKYSAYSQTWHSIIQSISVLSKESYSKSSN